MLGAICKSSSLFCHRIAESFKNQKRQFKSSGLSRSDIVLAKFCILHFDVGVLRRCHPVKVTHATPAD